MYIFLLGTLLAAIAPPVNTLGVSGTTFTIDGKPTFLLGASYYGALGVEDTNTYEADLDDLKRAGVNWIRVWATWAYDEDGMSAVTPDGAPREPYMGRLKTLCRIAAEKGMIVDVTLSRGKAPNFPSTQEEHLAELATLARELKPYRNLYFDVANERNIGDARRVPMIDVADLIRAVKQIDPTRLCTASHGGDIARDEVLDYITLGRVDFLCPHRPREADTPNQTEKATRQYLQYQKDAPRQIPIHYQEPFRRGYAEWSPVASDFTKDLQASRNAGAAGWCFHNGATRTAKDGRPRRSFDMRPKEGRLQNQLDPQERDFLKSLPGETK